LEGEENRVKLKMWDEGQIGSGDEGLMRSGVNTRCEKSLEIVPHNTYRSYYYLNVSNRTETSLKQIMKE